MVSISLRRLSDRLPMFQAAAEYRTDAFRLSFKGVIATIVPCKPIFRFAPDSVAANVVLMSQRAADRLPDRRNRPEPRAFKRRKKNHQLLGWARCEYQEIIGGSRYEKPLTLRQSILSPDSSATLSSSPRRVARKLLQYFFTALLDRLFYVGNDQFVSFFRRTKFNFHPDESADITQPCTQFLQPLDLPQRREADFPGNGFRPFNVSLDNRISRPGIRRPLFQPGKNLLHLVPGPVQVE